MDEQITLRHVLLGIAGLVIPFGVGYFLFYIGSSICPGAYPNSKFYSLNGTEQQVKLAIQMVKEEHPEISMGDGSTLKDHQHNYNFIVYFCYSDDGTMLFTWTRPEFQDSSDERNPQRTTFAFCSFYPAHNPEGHWIDVTECGRNEKKDAVAKFEERILKKIVAKLQTIKS